MENHHAYQSPPHQYSMGTFAYPLSSSHCHSEDHDQSSISTVSPPETRSGLGHKHPGYQSYYTPPPYYEPASHHEPIPPQVHSGYGYYPPRMSLPYPYHYEASSSWIPPPVEFVTDIQPEDVLSGRGGATNSHSGNKAFRGLVKSYQDEYLRAKKRDKPAVASKVVDLIRQKGGRFLKKHGADFDGRVLWTEIGDMSAREKTCQALRENAPELRRKKAHSLDDDELMKKQLFISSSNDGTDTSATQSPPTGMKEAPKEARVKVDAAEDYRTDEGPILIRPSPQYIPYFVNLPSESISIDDLPPQQRDMYLSDFLPPDPYIPKQCDQNYFIESVSS